MSSEKKTVKLDSLAKDFQVLRSRCWHDYRTTY